MDSASLKLPRPIFKHNLRPPAPSQGGSAVLMQTDPSSQQPNSSEPWEEHSLGLSKTPTTNHSLTQ